MWENSLVPNLLCLPNLFFVCFGWQNYMALCTPVFYDLLAVIYLLF